MTRRVQLLLSTVDSEEKARSLAEVWVGSRRAACVTVLPGAQSTYRWKGEICRDQEWVLLIKTAFVEADRDRVLAAFAEDHPYDEPEFLVIQPDAGAAGYLAWVLDQTEKSTDPRGTDSTS